MQAKNQTLSSLQSLFVPYVHATGFSQWLMTNLQAPNLFGENLWYRGG
ncbi:MAG: hypothetical protein NZ805_05840 [Armatimonadetes bacterium]|nr:hypothetical protein [Armatimonadota bacterium]MDW8028048.1 hypothetical protein [Armatimonadota bacterium]